MGPGVSTDARVPSGHVDTWFATKDGDAFDAGTPGGSYLDGNWNAIPNAAATAESWRVVAAAGQRISLTRLMIGIQGGGSFSGWGPIGALTNGIRVRYSVGGNVTDLTKVPWLTHADISLLNYDVQEIPLGGGTNVVAARWTFAKHGSPIVLRSGDYIEVVLNDDFSGVTKQAFVFEGKD